jgi:hypothetical protein
MMTYVCWQPCDWFELADSFGGNAAARLQRVYVQYHNSTASTAYPSNQGYAMHGCSALSKLIRAACADHRQNSELQGGSRAIRKVQGAAGQQAVSRFTNKQVSKNRLHAGQPKMQLDDQSPGKPVQLSIWQRCT